MLNGERIKSKSNFFFLFGNHLFRLDFLPYLIHHAFEFKIDLLTNYVSLSRKMMCSFSKYLHFLFPLVCVYVYIDIQCWSRLIFVFYKCIMKKTIRENIVQQEKMKHHLVWRLIFIWRRLVKKIESSYCCLNLRANEYVVKKDKVFSPSFIDHKRLL